MNASLLLGVVMCGLVSSTFAYTLNHEAREPLAAVLKRQYGDMTINQHLGEMQQTKPKSKGCRQFGCGIDIIARGTVKRLAADQRMAELQALVSLARGNSGSVGHGMFDPYSIGKRSGGYGVSEESSDELDKELLRRVVLAALADEDTEHN